MNKNSECSIDKELYGVVTVGERGQIVIPADARKTMDINPGDKLIVMGHPFGNGLILAKMDTMREFLAKFMEGLSGVESQHTNGDSE